MGSGGLGRIMDLQAEEEPEEEDEENDAHGNPSAVAVCSDTSAIAADGQ
jgi:hypothetical protein